MKKFEIESFMRAKNPRIYLYSAEVKFVAHLPNGNTFKEKDTEKIVVMNRNGQVLSIDVNDPSLKFEEQPIWANVYLSENGYRLGSSVFDSEVDAASFGVMSSEYVKTIQI